MAMPLAHSVEAVEHGRQQQYMNMYSILYGKETASNARPAIVSLTVIGQEGHPLKCASVYDDFAFLSLIESEPARLASVRQCRIRSRWVTLNMSCALMVLMVCLR